MKPLFFKKMIILPGLLMYLLLTSHTVLSQTNPTIKKAGNLRLEKLIVTVRTTVEEGMTSLDSIDDNYLTKLSGLVNYDRAYLSKASEKQFF